MLCYVRNDISLDCNIKLGAMSFRGLNYGQLDIEEDPNKMTLVNRGHPILSLDYASITNSTINKHDIII
jgi:hypothetical protein